jgi:magnesium transporter
MSPTAEILRPEIQELINLKRFRDLRAALEVLEASDVAETLETLEPADAAVAFRLLPRDLAGESLAELEQSTQEDLITALGKYADRIVEAMDPDDRAALLDEMPDSVARKLIAGLSPEERRITQEILGYPGESVGRLMTPDYVRAYADWTVARTLEHIRTHGRDAETIHWVYVVDEGQRLVDDIHIRKFLLADPGATVAELMDDRFIALDAKADREEAVLTMNRYDRSALPVVDSRGMLVGIVTHDDVADVAEEEATEDIQKLAGMGALDEPYMHAPFGEMLKKRGGWLMLLFLGQMVTVAVLGMSEGKLATVLVLFIPMIIASGGNSGTQTASLLIRALALREVEPGDWWRVFRKELLTGLCLGSVLGVMGVASVLFWHKIGVAQTDEPLLVGLAVGTSIVGIVIWAVVLGAMFPLILEKLGFDPATISSPLVATLMDMSGLGIYLTVAFVILSGTVM